MKAKHGPQERGKAGGGTRVPERSFDGLERPDGVTWTEFRDLVSRVVDGSKFRLRVVIRARGADSSDDRINRIPVTRCVIEAFQDEGRRSVAQKDVAEPQSARGFLHSRVAGQVNRPHDRLIQFVTTEHSHGDFKGSKP